MNNLEIFTLKTLRKVYGRFQKTKSKPYDRGITDPDRASELIYTMLSSGKPCMIARYGAFELAMVINCLGIKDGPQSCMKYIQGKASQWWWNKNLMSYMETNTGFFPSIPSTLMRFGEMMIEDSRQVDVLGSWLVEEMLLKERYKLDFQKITLLALEPYWAKNPWSRVLKGKKVLVVHPFASLIEMQYKEKRTHLFNNGEVLPEFELHTIRAVQSLGGNSEYKDWFEALDSMKQQMDSIDYDIALIGCGAYGFPLAAHAKRMGKQAVHLGGALQLMFGIKGKRWENPEYGARVLGKKNAYNDLFNDFWIRPSDKFIPSNAQNVEGACYW